MSSCAHSAELPSKQGEEHRPFGSCCVPPSPTCAERTKELNDCPDWKPSIHGPPSPESIRAFQIQVKDSSASLSLLRSQERPPSWENTTETLTLSRRSSGRSGRSSSSNMPCKDRPDSVQIFGKAIFPRRSRLRRQSNAQKSKSSPSLSKCPSEGSLMLPRPKKSSSSIPGLFRRRMMRENNVAKPKLIISSPYNFQHLTHTDKEQAIHLSRTSRMLGPCPLASYSCAPHVRTGTLHLPGLSNSVPLDKTTMCADEARLIAHNRNDSLALESASPPYGVASYPKPWPPARPLRSPLDQLFVVHSLPVPPPRHSSRLTRRHHDYSLAPSAEQSWTSTSINQAEYCSDATLTLEKDPILQPGNDGIDWTRLSHIHSPSGDANWPLTCPTESSVSTEAALANVAEEEEASAASPRSQPSAMRGNESVIELSIQEQPTNRRRRLSGASDTLGIHPRALLIDTSEDTSQDTQANDNWEDDIDYCYDHAVEADCDYAWDRPSCDMVREALDLGEGSCALGSAQSDVPPLSPDVQQSPVNAHEAITPTFGNPSYASNFSLPRTDALVLRRKQHMRSAPISKDLNGFVSPLVNCRNQPAIAAEDDGIVIHGVLYDGEDSSLTTMDTASLPPRTSVLATLSSGSVSLRTSSSGFERHISTASSATDVTRFTSSTSATSLDEMDCPILAAPSRKDPIVFGPAPFDTSAFHSRSESQTLLPTLLEDETADAQQDHKPTMATYASESDLARCAASVPVPWKDPRRQHMRPATLNMMQTSSQPPFQAQYTVSALHC